jgi:hypothetical protein
MIIPTLFLTLRRNKGFDKFGQPVYSSPERIKVAPVKLDIGQMHTTVRTDSSATHAYANEGAADVVVLAQTRSKVAIDDRIEFKGAQLRVVSVHARYTVGGAHDHDEVHAKFAAF